MKGFEAGSSRFEAGTRVRPPASSPTSDSRLESRSGGEMKKILLVLTVVGIGFLAWRYFSNEPV